MYYVQLYSKGYEKMQMIHLEHEKVWYKNYTLRMGT